MLKKVLCVMLMAAMLIISMASCQKDGETAQTTTAAQSNGSTPQDTQAQKKVIDISVGFAGLTSFDDPMADIIKDKVKINVEPIDLSAPEKVNLLASTNDLPDMFMTTSINPILPDWTEQGLLRDIPADIYSKYQLVQQMMNNDLMLQTKKEQQGGKVYYVPVPLSVSGAVKSNIQGIFFREDWRKQVGIAKDPETLDELYEVLKAFTFNDPDQNGQQDTYGLNGKVFDIHFLPWGISTAEWTFEDGKWIPGFFSKNALSALQFYHKLYKEKILDPEFSVTGGDKLIERFAKGACGMMFRVAEPFWARETIGKSFAAANPNIANPLEAVTILPPLKVDANSKPYWPKQVDLNGVFFSHSVDDEKLDRCIELLEYLSSNEGSLLRNLGIENVDYKLDGTTVYRDNALASVAEKYRSVQIFNMANWNFDWNLDPKNTAFPEEYKKLYQKKAADYDPAADNFNLNLNIKFMSTPAKDRFSMNFDAYVAQVIMSDDPAAEYAKIIKEQYDSKGAKEAIDEVNKKAAEMGIQP